MRVHPAADVFPMLSDNELDALGADILANGLQQPIWFIATPNKTHTSKNLLLVDGRNRLEAIERAGIQIPDMKRRVLPHYKDAVAHIISLNIHRRHLTKQQQADLIVAAHIAAGKADLVCAAFDAASEGILRQLGEVSKGGRGKKDAVKEAAVKAAAEHGISKRTVERSIAKAEGRTPKPKPVIGDAEWQSLVSEDVEEPAQVVTNFLDSIRNAKSVAEAYRKIFKASSFDREAKKQMCDEINLLIAKWRKVQSTLEEISTEKSCAACDGNHGKGCPHCKPDNYGMPPKKAGGGRDGPNLSADTKASAPLSAKARS